MNTQSLFGAAFVDPTLAQVQKAGFPMGGESLAVDLADTLVTVTAPATDLIADQDASDRFWTLHAGLLPAGWTLPAAAESRRIRDAVRAVLDAVQQRTSLAIPALDTVNALSELAQLSDYIVLRDGDADRRERWHYRHSSDLAPAAAARDAIELLTNPTLRAAIRRCSSPTCSMLYVKGDARRRWCTPNICANRDRAARHYRRRRKSSKG